MTDSEPGSEGVDYAWVMQTTFVVTILVGAPLVAVLSAFLSLPTWGARAEFAVRVGAVVWILTGVAVYLYARRNDVGGNSGDLEMDSRSGEQPPSTADGDSRSADGGSDSGEKP